MTHTTPYAPDCAHTIVGKTHFEGDNCGCPAHNSPEIPAQDTSDRKSWEESRADFRRYFVEMHPMDGRDSHNPPLLHHSDPDEVQELEDFIHDVHSSAYERGKGDALRAVEEGVDKLEKEILPTHAEENGYSCSLEDIRALINELK